MIKDIEVLMHKIRKEKLRMFNRRYRKRDCTAAAIIGFVVAVGVSVYVANKILSEKGGIKDKMKALMGKDKSFDETEEGVCYCDDPDFDDDQDLYDVEVDETTIETGFTDEEAVNENGIVDEDDVNIQDEEE